MNFVRFSMFMKSMSAVLITSERKCASLPVFAEAVSRFLDELAMIIEVLKKASLAVKL